MVHDVCDVCGLGQKNGGPLQGIRLIPRGDYLLCPACLLGLGEDNRSLCPRCGTLVPIGYCLAHWCHENIFINTCSGCGYIWDERLEGENAEMWQALGVRP